MDFNQFNQFDERHSNRKALRQSDIFDDSTLRQKCSLNHVLRPIRTDSFGQFPVSGDAH